MDIRQLKAFVEVAANGSFARAALTVGVAQSALSRQVSALERVVDAKLFHRNGRGVVLTELGERMLPRARALIADAEAWEAAAQQERSEPYGEVTLGVVPVASRNLIAELVAELRQNFPGIKLRALEAYSGQVEEWLASGRIEIGIYNRYGRGRVANSDLLGRADVHLVARPDHPSLKSREVALRAFADIPLAVPLRPNSLTSALMGLAASQQFELDIRLEASSTALTREVMMASDLATVSPWQVFSREIASGQLKSAPIVRPKVIQSTWMTLSAHHPPSVATDLVARVIRKLATRQRGAKAG